MKSRCLCTILFQGRPGLNKLFFLFIILIILIQTFSSFKAYVLILWTQVVRIYLKMLTGCLWNNNWTSFLCFSNSKNGFPVWRIMCNESCGWMHIWLFLVLFDKGQELFVLSVQVIKSMIESTVYSGISITILSKLTRHAYKMLHIHDIFLLSLAQPVGTIP